MTDYIVPVGYDTLYERLQVMDRDGFVYSRQQLC